MSSLIDGLQLLGVLRDVDAALGRLLAAKTTAPTRLVGIAGALASAALAHGHSCLPLADAARFVRDSLPGGVAMPGDFPDVPSLRSALLGSPLVGRDAAAPAALVFDISERIYLRRYFVYEQCVAAALLERRSPAPVDPSIQLGATGNDLEYGVAGEADTPRVDIDQRIAVLLSARLRLLVITGGPGSGKTTTVQRLLAFAFSRAQACGRAAPRVALAAPTGKAAARLAEILRPRGAGQADAATQLPIAATTLHRLLGWMPGRVQARYGRDNPLPFDLIVVDEASMLDLALAARLCEALAPQTQLVLLGDRDQLASVEAGSVFGAVCNAAAGGYSSEQAKWLQVVLGHEVPSTAHPTPLGDALVELRGNHRFGIGSAIGQFAAALRVGDCAAALAAAATVSSAVQIEEVPAAALRGAVLQRILPHYVGLTQATTAAQAFAWADGFRALCALREGPFGTLAINAMIEHELRRNGGHGDAHAWFAGRMILIGGNDYGLGLFNGDIGIALATGVNAAVEVWFRTADGGLRALPPAMLPQHDPAYALTVHKAQGSEFDRALIVLPQRDARLLTRELLYTAVTRARKDVELWTSKAIFAAAIARTTQRWSGLPEALSAVNPLTSVR